MSKRMNEKKARELFEWWKESNEDVLNDELYDDEQEKKDREELAQALNIIADSLDNEWVDTKIKTPKNIRKVIATTTDGFVGEMNYDPKTKEWYHYGDLVFEGVIGWKEKPKPYKRKENENE